MKPFEQHTHHMTSLGGALAVAAILAVAVSSKTGSVASAVGRPATNAHETASSSDMSIRPFKVTTSAEALTNLRRRIAATRWPERETVTDTRKACSSRRCRSSRAIGRRSTTGARSKRG